MFSKSFLMFFFLLFCSPVGAVGRNEPRRRKRGTLFADSTKPAVSAEEVAAVEEKAERLLLADARKKRMVGRRRTIARAAAVAAAKRPTTVSKPPGRKISSRDKDCDLLDENALLGGERLLSRDVYLGRNSSVASNVPDEVGNEREEKEEETFNNSSTAKEVSGINEADVQSTRKYGQPNDDDEEDDDDDDDDDDVTIVYPSRTPAQPSNPFLHLFSSFNFKGFGIVFAKSLVKMDSFGMGVKIPVTQNFPVYDSMLHLPRVNVAIGIYNPLSLRLSTSFSLPIRILAYEMVMLLIALQRQPQPQPQPQPQSVSRTAAPATATTDVGTLSTTATIADAVSPSVLSPAPLDDQTADSVTQEHQNARILHISDEFLDFLRSKTMHPSDTTRRIGVNFIYKIDAIHGGRLFIGPWFFYLPSWRTFQTKILPVLMIVPTAVQTISAIVAGFCAAVFRLLYLLELLRALSSRSKRQRQATGISNLKAPSPSLNADSFIVEDLDRPATSRRGRGSEGIDTNIDEKKDLNSTRHHRLLSTINLAESLTQPNPVLVDRNTIDSSNAGCEIDSRAGVGWGGVLGPRRVIGRVSEPIVKSRSWRSMSRWFSEKKYGLAYSVGWYSTNRDSSLGSSVRIDITPFHVPVRSWAAALYSYVPSTLTKITSSSDSTPSSSSSDAAEAVVDSSMQSSSAVSSGPAFSPHLPSSPPSTSQSSDLEPNNPTKWKKLDSGKDAEEEQSRRKKRLVAVGLGQEDPGEQGDQVDHIDPLESGKG